MIARSVLMLLTIALAPLALGGCALIGFDRQLAMIRDICLISGTVETQSEDGELVVVVLQPDDAEAGTIPMPVDYAIADVAGQWQFALEPGSYSLLAFHDANGNLILDDDEAAHWVGDGEPLECAAGARLVDNRIFIEADARLPTDRALAVTRDRAIFRIASEVVVSMGQLTAYGEVVPLSDPRFDIDRAKDSLWRPMDFVRDGYSGIYLLEPLDSDRIPVLFVHGINGSPRVLATPIEMLDTERFQPMFYYYPSGLRLDQISSHLYGITREMELRHNIEIMYVIAHSMGGLVARAWLLERERRGSSASVPVFISLSTPWLGYDAAQMGLDYSPVVIPVWRDMATGSEFLSKLFADSEPVGLGHLEHHLLFSYRQDGWISREAGDGVSTLASMLAPAVQQGAASIYAVDSSHMGILESADALERIAQILARIDDRDKF